MNNYCLSFKLTTNNIYIILFLFALLISNTAIGQNYYKIVNETGLSPLAGIQYVIFPLIPDNADSNKALSYLVGLREHYNDSLHNEKSILNLLNTYSETDLIPEKYYAPNEISNIAFDYLFNNKLFSISHDLLFDNGYHFLIPLDFKTGNDCYINASHILIEFKEDTIAAKLKADSVFKMLIEGNDFPIITALYSDDKATIFKEGKLGWFGKGTMIAEFEEAAYNGKINEVVGPVKTMFGWHIIRINDRTNKSFRFADFKSTIRISEININKVQNKVNEFLNISNLKGFSESANELNLQINGISNIKNGAFIPFFGFNKEVNHFIFNNPVGSISGPIKANNSYVIIRIASIIEK